MSLLRKRICIAKRFEALAKSSNPFGFQIDKALRGINRKFADRLRGCIVTETDVTLDDIEGNGAAKQALDEVVVMPAKYAKVKSA